MTDQYGFNQNAGYGRYVVCRDNTDANRITDMLYCIVDTETWRVLEWHGSLVDARRQAMWLQAAE